MGKKLENFGLERNSPSSNWRIRRRIITITLLFCAFLVLYITLKGIDSRTNETIIQSAFALAGAVIGAYVFGAVYEDKAKIGSLLDQNQQIDSVKTEIKTHTVDNPDA